MSDTAIEILMDSLYPVDALMKMPIEDFAFQIAEANGFIKGLKCAGLLTKEQAQTWHSTFVFLAEHRGKQ